MRLQHIVMNVTALKQFAQHVADLLADSKQTDRTAFRSLLSTHLERPSAFLDLEPLKRVAWLDVVRVSKQHTALEAGNHLRNVVLEPPQRADRRLRHDDVLASEAGVEALADDAFEDEQACGLVLLACRKHFLDP